MRQKQFPIIEHMDTVLEAINSKPEFYINKKDGYYVAGYTHQDSNTFNQLDADFDVLRECRGIMFDEDGYIIRRPLHKFFNVGEKPSTAVSEINWNNITKIQRKLDGSMVAPFRLGKYIRWGTKAGLSDVALAAEVFVASHPGFVEFAEAEINRGYTPIFEFCSPRYQIVEKQEKDTLTYICSRNMITGVYDYSKTVLVDNNIPPTLEDVLNTVRALPDMEGVVIIGDDHYKVKSDWYIQLHRAKDDINSEHKIIGLILDQKLDDLRPNLSKEDLEKVNKIEQDFMMTLAFAITDADQALGHFHNETGGDKKKFALEFAPKMKKFPRSIMYSLWPEGHLNYNKQKIEDTILKIIRKNINQEIKWQQFKKEYFNVT